MELDKKQQVLLAIYTEYQKDIPEMKKNITAENLALDVDVFKVAIAKLQHEGLITDVVICKSPKKAVPRKVKLEELKITKYGINYVEDKLNIEETLDNKEKLKQLAESTGRWGFEQLKDLASKTLAEIITKAAGN